MGTTDAVTTDLPDRSTVRSLLRLWPYVRPVRTRLFVAAFVAVVASCLALLFPLVLKWMVDGPISGRDPAGVWLGALWLLLLGIAEAVLFGLRRWLVARPLAGVEASMRADLYRHLQRLPVAFHDRWASGQLLSRGTTDLMLVRMFLAFPLTFLLVNSVTILAGVSIMLVQQWTLGLVLLAPAIPVMIVCWLFERRYSEVARKAQDQVGDLTTVVEESVLGIRIIKGFGRHRSQARAFRDLSGTLRGTELAKARLLASIWAVIVTLPELAIGAALVLGTVQVADGDLSAGTLVAFLSTALALRWPVDSIGFLLAMSQEAATATERYFEVMDAEPESSLTPTPSARTAAVGTAGGPSPSTERAGRPSVSAEPDQGPAHAPEPAPAAGGRDTSAPAKAPATAPTPTPAVAVAVATQDVPVPVGTPVISPAPESSSAPGPAPVDVRVGRGGVPGPAHAPVAGGGQEPAHGSGTPLAEGGLRFEGVAFRYPDAAADAPPVLARVDLHIRSGESMALVGTTGSGKTTLTALVPRLHEVTSGRITLDGRDVTGMPREELRELVAVAFEEPTLFSATVGENVLMGAADTAGQDELDRALAVAQADFAHSLPEGTATQVGEQGLSLSGGQRQRLALARAVVGRPRFLVLDDPLSALDVHTEAAVEAALRRVLAETTALIVAHRPSTVLLADRVALLSGGRITAVGTHHELLRTNAEYAHLMSGAEEDDR
ncbi:ABC transporter ATP-binding protein [Streptomyces sp. SID14446]|uniref:ABC transporter ATP-binding protein n=1 Tax=Streptomyces sp. SID14446 TaxID=2706072 RepID=UPI0013B6F812|nr:ABC transporter ATP-binding protein [Streptomyces sp. SID14446]NEB27623.1 ABC transporter ATP-binding protein [Streptomyces sp. SID14446]